MMLDEETMAGSCNGAGAPPEPTELTNIGIGSEEGGGQLRNAPPAHFPGACCCGCCCFEALAGGLAPVTGGANCLFPTANGRTAVALLAFAAAMLACGPD
jgi:hypothetical protein